MVVLPVSLLKMHPSFREYAKCTLYVISDVDAAIERRCLLEEGR